jgi:alpha-tubulin suppressor-like RCC1 family protein
MGLAVGGGQACAAMVNGNAQCWGANSAGQLGSGTSAGPKSCGIASIACSPLPLVVKNSAGSGPLTGVVKVTAGEDTSAVIVNGTADCWGDNELGQLGIGTTTGPQSCGNGGFSCSTLPVVVNNTEGSGALTGVVEVVSEAGAVHTYTRMSNGTADCWGTDSSR